MIDWIEALNKILDQVEPIKTEKVFILNALGRVLAEPVFAPQNIPPYDNSAMDGFAIKVKDLSFSNEFEVVGEVSAGTAQELKITKGQAVRIMTGGEIPKGMDAVVRVEDTEKISSQRVKVLTTVTQGQNIRKCGEDVQKGKEILSLGQKLNTYLFGILGSMGVSEVKVFQRPQVAIVPTGNELVEFGKPTQEISIFDSNGPMLEASVQSEGAAPERMPVTPDNRVALRSTLQRALESDVVLTSGGVSMGSYDYVKGVLQDLGVKIIFHKAAIRPGKPLLFGVKQGTHKTYIFGLPGNPVSTMVTYEIFVRPFLRKLMGMRKVQPVMLQARLLEPLKKKKGFTYFVRGVLEEGDGNLKIRSTGPQGSHLLTSLAHANALMVLDQDQTHFEKGDMVNVLPLLEVDWGNESP